MQLFICVWLLVAGSTASTANKSVHSGGDRSAGHFATIYSGMKTGLLSKKKLDDGMCTVKTVCNSNSPYYTTDGTCNNIHHPKWGAAMEPLQRVLPAEYETTSSSTKQEDKKPRGFSRLKSPRIISTLVHREQDMPDHKITHMVMQFGQFLDHDISLTMESEVEGGCCSKNKKNEPECNSIQLPHDQFYNDKSRRPSPQTCLDLTRSMAYFCNETTREQFSGITAYLDSSNIYGSEEKLAYKLRGGSNRKHGQLLTGAFDLLPKLEDDHGSIIETAGDIRAAEQPGLTSMHTIWMREHNRLATDIQKKNPEFDDETVYQKARRLVTAEWQNIIYSEWLPIIIGPDAIKQNHLDVSSQEKKYDKNTKANIINSFATAAFRFGHSLIQGSFDLVSKDGHKTSEFHLRDNFFEQGLSLYRKNNGATMVEILKGLTLQKSQSFDQHATRDITQHLFQSKDKNFGSDLISRNIQRGRDHGLPGFNKFRSLCNLPKLKNFNTPIQGLDYKKFSILKYIYHTVEDIDLFTGGTLEAPVKDGVVGPTFACIIGQQFRRLKYGDRHFFTHTGQAGSLSSIEFDWASKRKLRDLLCDNTDIISLQESVFLENGPQLTCGVKTKNLTEIDNLKNEIEVLKKQCTVTLSTSTTPQTTTTTNREKTCTNPKLITPSMITCTASSEFNRNYPCSKAFDGLSSCPVNGDYLDWLPRAYKKVGQWIQANFNQAITIMEVKIMSPFLKDRAFKDIELLFDGDLRVEKELTVQGCNSWDIISLDKPVVTKTMKIKINSVHQNVKHHGIKEIAIYGCLN